jgi:hypothetical protein
MTALPLSFELNAGQTDPSVRFMAHASGSIFYFANSEVVIALPVATGKGAGISDKGLGVRGQVDAPSKPSVARLQFIGADVGQVTGEGNTLPGKVNYIRGKDKARWHTNIATYPSIAYENLYPGIGLHYKGVGGRLKGTYVISAHADPSKIRWRYTGAHSTTLDDEGRLKIDIVRDQADGQPVTLTEEVPIAWQEIDGNRVPVDARYNLQGDGIISFLLGTYNSAYAIIVDPTITYSTYLGGTGVDVCVGIAVRNGNAYVTGWTNSVNFPLQNPLQPTNHGGAYDVFVTELSASGSALVYSTYLGAATGTRRRA